jgi:hypothetical protein
MTTDHDLDRQLDAFLQAGPSDLPDASFDAVRDLIDHTGQRAAIGPWRIADAMNKFVSLGLGAAAVVVALIIGTQLLGPIVGGVGGAPSPEPVTSATPAATAEPTPEPTPEGLLPEGPHVILDGQADDPADVFAPLTVTIPAPGWYGEVAGGILMKNDQHGPPDGAGMIIFVQREFYVYGDACTWKSTVPASPATTVDAFVAALSSQGSRTATDPVDITLGGYAGKSITLRVSDDVDFAACDPGFAGSWACDPTTMEPCGYHDGREEIDTVYVLDVDGQVMAWNTGYYAGTPAEDIAELEAIVQSATFGE